MVGCRCGLLMVPSSKVQASSSHPPQKNTRAPRDAQQLHPPTCSLRVQLGSLPCVWGQVTPHRQFVTAASEITNWVAFADHRSPRNRGLTMCLTTIANRQWPRSAPPMRWSLGLAQPRITHSGLQLHLAASSTTVWTTKYRNWCTPSQGHCGNGWPTGPR